MELHQLDLNKLNTFLSVVECGGVSAAARRLGVTPSAVSQALSSLEASLGLPLFHRSGRRLVPTREAELLRARLGEYQLRLRETLDEIARAEREPRGTVRLGLYLGFPRPRLARFLTRFSAAHPEVTVKLLYGALEDLDGSLLENRLDFVFSFHRAGARGLRATRLLRQDLVLVSGRRWFRRRFDLDALRATPIVDYYRSSPQIQRWARHHFRRKPPQLPVRIWAATTDLVLELVLQQAGVAVLPAPLVAPYLARRRLFQVRTGRPEIEDAIWLKELTGAYRSAGLQAFRRSAISELASD